ncbi:MAG: glycosyltransferase [Pseudomonadota bacterium]
MPWLVPRLRWPFTFEAIAQYHTYVERAFLEHAKAVAPDVVVIDYLFSALFIPGVFDLPVRRILVSLNNESDFFADQCRLSRNNAGTSRSAIARLRLARFERAVCVKSDRVVALSINDLPSDIAHASSTRIIPPALDASPMRWSPSREASLFFVGNVAHYPNFLAIKWLAEEFAPALAEVMPGGRIRIVGAAAADVAEAWRKSNIEFLGTSDAETVKTLFATSTLFIAPIENAFGSKMKVLQCLSHATPVLASAAALSGLPFEGVVPLLRLDDPRAAAETAKRLMTNPALLVDLSARLAREHAAFLARSESAWDELIVAACRSPARRAPSRGLASAIDWLLDVPDSPRRPGYSVGVAGASAALTT